MPSPKLIFLGISGAGVTAGSLAAWQLTKNNLKIINTWDEFEKEVASKCGKDTWTNDLNQKDDKGWNWYNFRDCRTRLEQLYPEFAPPPPPRKK